MQPKYTQSDNLQQKQLLETLKMKLKKIILNQNLLNMTDTYQSLTQDRNQKRDGEVVVPEQEDKSLIVD